MNESELLRWILLHPGSFVLTDKLKDGRIRLVIDMSEYDLPAEGLAIIDKIFAEAYAHNRKRRREMAEHGGPGAKAAASAPAPQIRVDD